MHLIEFLKGKKIIYLLVIDIIIILILFLFIFLFLIGLNHKKKNFFNTIFSDILKIVIPIFSISFFGQIFYGLLSVSKCENGFIFYDLTQKCNNDYLFLLEQIFSIISIICLFIITIFVVSIFYVPIFFKGNNAIRKISSIPEQIFFFNKIIIIIIFYIEDFLNRKNKSINIWLMLLILVIFSSINAYFSFIYKNLENKIILLINNIMSLLLFWGFFSLLFGLIFKYTGYSGTYYLFLTGAILIVIYNIYYKIQYQKYFWKNINNIYTNQGRLDYILKCINIIEKRNNSRKNKIILKSLIEKIELYCIDPHCKIKQYMHHLKKGIDSSILLYDFCQELFKQTISKNKNDITAKIYYIIFLMTKLNRRKEAYILLEKLEDRQLVLFQDLFNIYRAKKLLEELTFGSSNKENNNHYINSITLTQYKKYLREFKYMLYRISSLYLNFWTLLLNSQNHNENIEILNNTGKEIKDLIQTIDEIFNKIYNFKNDIKIIRLYINFIQNVLTDKKAYEKYHKYLMNISLDYKKLNNEEDYSNYDINKLKESDEIQWMIVSADDKDPGKILNISLGVCTIIGYKKNEIIGNNINVLIPNIYHRRHDHMIKKLFYDSKYEFYENLSKKIEYKPEIISKVVYCKNKSKYLVHFPFKCFFTQTEEGEHIFLMNIMKQNCFPHSNNKKGEEPWCCVLTNKHFVIQTFTPNAFNILGLNSSDIDSGLNITTCINQFGNEMFNSINNRDNTIESNDFYNYSSEANYETNKSYLNNNTLKSEKKLKRELTKKDYSSPQIISWTFNHDKQRYKFKNNIKVISKLSSDKYEIKIKEANEKKLMLKIKESKINNEIVGYKFLFKKNQKDENELLLNKNNCNNENEEELLESAMSEVSCVNEVSHIPSQATLRSNARDSVRRYDSSLSLKINNKPSMISIRRNSQGNFHQTINLNNFAFSFNIDMNFIPINKSDFIFDRNRMSFIYHSKFNRINNNNVKYNLPEILLKESKEKISFLQSNYELSKNMKTISDKRELISNSNEKSSSSSNSESDSNSSSVTYLSNSIKEPEPQPEPDASPEHRHYNSFMFQKSNKNQGNVVNISGQKNRTTKSHFGLKKSIKDQPLFEQIVNQMKEKTKVNMDFNHYEVNVKHIRLLKYDFYREMIVEDHSNDKKSRISELINELKSNYDNLLHKDDDDYPYIDVNHFIQNKKKNRKSSLNEIKKKIEKEPNKKIDIDKMIFNKDKQQNEIRLEKEKKIEEALNKKGRQNSIKNFIIISIFCLLLLYGICGIILYLYLKEVSNDKKNIKLISESTDLKFFFNSAVYMIRELTLLNINNITDIQYGDYTGFPAENKTIYISILIDEVLELYSNIHSLNENIIATELPLSKNTSYFLNDKEFILETLTNDYDFISLRTGLSNAIISLDAYLYNLAELTSTIKQNHEDVYPFIHNTLNNVGTLLNIQIELYMNELKLRRHNNKILFIVVYVIVIVIFMIIVLIMTNAYSSFLTNKANYFYIFYGLNTETIHSLINNCEYFLQKLKEEQKILNDDIEEEKNEDNEEESNYLNQKIKEMNSMIGNSKASSQKSQNLNKVTLNQKISKENNINFKFSINIFIICFILFLFIIFAYLCLVMSDYFYFMNIISEYALYNYYLQEFHNGIIEIINGYREFMFDENSYINNTKSNNYINNKISQIYLTKFNENIIFNKYRKKIPDFLEKYNEFQSQTLCSRRNEYYFKSESECQSHMQGISNYGLSVVHTSITEEIRIYKNRINELLSNHSIVGNLTLYGSKYWNEEDIINRFNNQNNTVLYYRLYLFNDKLFHKDLNILFINAIYPYIDEERKMTVESINDSIKNKQVTYIIYFTCLLIVITILFIVYWLPMIKNMNITIYKTKKMLSIIPIHILSSQENINGLLNIEIDTKYKSNNDNN